MIKIGITGGIGSGKTTVCKIFEVLGIPIYYADDRAKELLESDKNVIKKVKNIFGDDVYNEQGKLDRHRVATIVFNFPEILAEYNAIIHPAVFKDTISWFQSHQDTSYALYEAAIMFESGSNKLMDKMITVFAPLEDRISRTMKRDKISREEVLERIDKQMPEEEKMKQADFIIYNDHSQPLIEQVLTIHHLLISLDK